jgi:hypothetical protein
MRQISSHWLFDSNELAGFLGPESGLDRLDSTLFVLMVLSRIIDRPISAFTRVFDALWAAALRAVLDKTINTNNQHPSDQVRHPDQCWIYYPEAPD